MSEAESIDSKADSVVHLPQVSNLLRANATIYFNQGLMIFINRKALIKIAKRYAPFSRNASRYKNGNKPSPVV